MHPFVGGNQLLVHCKNMLCDTAGLQFEGTRVDCLSLTTEVLLDLSFQRVQILHVNLCAQHTINLLSWSGKVQAKRSHRQLPASSLNSTVPEQGSESPE